MKALPLLIVVTTLAGSAFAEDWPHWRGPTRDGISGETGLPSDWSTTKNVSWRIPMPDRTGATPIIWGETVFWFSCRFGGSDLCWRAWPMDAAAIVENAENSGRERRLGKGCEHVQTWSGVFHNRLENASRFPRAPTGPS